MTPMWPPQDIYIMPLEVDMMVNRLVDAVTVASFSPTTRAVKRRGYDQRLCCFADLAQPPCPCPRNPIGRRPITVSNNPRCTLYCASGPPRRVCVQCVVDWHMGKDDWPASGVRARAGREPCWEISSNTGKKIIPGRGCSNATSCGDLKTNEESMRSGL
jgi:hypothetical protein